MKTIKFFLLFNLFFYLAMVFTLSFAALAVYQMDFAAFKILLLNYHQLLPVILLGINILLILIRTVSALLKWSNLYINYIILARKKRSGYVSLEKMSFSNL